LKAIIEKFTGEDKLAAAPTKKRKNRKNKRQKKKRNGICLKLRLLICRRNPRRIFSRHEKTFDFSAGNYKYESDWKGAIRAMRERMENPPSEKVRSRSKNWFRRFGVPNCEGKRLQPESLGGQSRRIGNCRLRRLDD
jgi:excinuclease UvrABC ATPase subunit